MGVEGLVLDYAQVDAMDKGMAELLVLVDPILHLEVLGATLLQETLVLDVVLNVPQNAV